MMKAWMRTQKVRNARGHAIGFIQPVHHFLIFIRFVLLELVSQMRSYISANWGRNGDELQKTYAHLRCFSFGVSSTMIPPSYIQVPNHDGF
jgi:hypothetical protein